MKLKIILASFLLLFLFSPHCFGWGQKGHDITAFIAETNLSDTTISQVETILGGKSIVYYANWLDNASNTPDYKYTKTWHYKNIDADQTFENAPLNEKGDIVIALNEQIALLKSHTLSVEEEQLALKMVIHLMGDLHQPLHMGHLSDRGGNNYAIKYFNRSRKLHSIWDSDLVEGAHNWSYSEWQYQIDRLPSDQEALIMAGTIEDWAKETYEIVKAVYESTPIGASLSYDYVAKWAPVIEHQFLCGGLRLAHILNSIYDPQYK